MKLRFLLAATLLWWIALPARAQEPAPITLRIDKLEVSAEESGATFNLVLGTNAPVGAVVRATLTFDAGMVAWNVLPKNGGGDAVEGSLGPFVGLVPGAYSVRAEFQAQDQNPEVLAANPRMPEAPPVVREVRVGDPATEKAERARYRQVYVSAAREFHELWLGIWHRTEAAVQALAWSKKAKKLTDDRLKAVREPWLAWVEGEYMKRLVATVKGVEDLCQGHLTAYEPELRNELLNHGALLRRARSGAWRRLSPLFGLPAPDDSKRDPSIPPPSLIRNVTDSLQKLSATLGEDLGLLELPEFPASHEMVDVVNSGGRESVTWKTLDTALQAPPGWTVDTLPGCPPLLSVLRSPDGNRTAELIWFCNPKVADEAALRARLDAETGVAGARMRDVGPFDLRLVPEGDRRFHGYQAMVASGGREERCFVVCELRPAKGVAFALRFRGPDATEQEFRAWRTQVDWPRGAKDVPEPVEPGGTEPGK